MNDSLLNIDNFNDCFMLMYLTVISSKISLDKMSFEMYFDHFKGIIDADIAILIIKLNSSTCNMN